MEQNYLLGCSRYKRSHFGIEWIEKMHEGGSYSGLTKHFKFVVTESQKEVLSEQSQGSYINGNALEALCDGNFDKTELRDLRRVDVVSCLRHKRRVVAA